ncbi:PQQ-like beta-propeller repeat protein [bacterium]|nr:PQQ-like beta-propeller repeat protein [bacterium]
MKRILLLASTLLVSPLAASEWPFFAGPNFNGASSETGWKADWGDDGPKIAWKAKVGTGAASFVVSGKRVITSGANGDKETVFCFDADSGKALWKNTFDCEFEKRMFDGGTAATPTIDGDRVYNLSYDGQLQCLSLENGKVIWKTHLIEKFGGKLSRWKYSSSPLVVGDLLILDNGGKGNSTLALNKNNGRKVWGNGDENAGYSTPTPIKLRGKDAVLVFKGTALVAHDLKTGKRLWEVPWKTSYDVNASSPVPLPNDQLIVSSGYNDGRVALFDLSSGKPRKLWTNEDIKTKMSSCVVYNGHVFAVCGDTNGQLICVSLKDGKTQWAQKGFGMGTLTLAGGKLLALSDKGNLVVAEATGNRYTPISQAQLLSKRCWVKPVLSDGRLFVKNNRGDVVCADLR